jgi:uroporphyrinogen III methyltransferase/synthase
VPENRASSLAGKRIVITRAATQSEALAQELSARGAFPVVLPLVSFAEPEDFVLLDRAIAEMNQFDWLILTSAQAVRAMVQRAAELQQPLVRTGNHLRVACVGPVTAEAARNAKLPVEYVAVTHNGVALANELGSKVQGAKALLPRSDRANPDLPAALKRYGAQVTEVIAYRTVRPTESHQDSLKRIAAGQADAILFFSPSAVQHFAELVGAEKFRALQDTLAIAAVGPVTAKALREAGVERVVVSADTTTVAVVEALEKHFAAAKAAPAGAKQA